MEPTSTTPTQKTPSRRIAEQLLAKVGVTINGDKPYDIAVHNERVYGRALAEGSLGVAESYIQGDWDTEDLPELLKRMALATEDSRPGLVQYLLALRQTFTNRQSITKSREVGKRHYDISHELYEHMLGTYLMYSCSYTRRGATALNEAQEAKLRLIAEKLDLKPGMRVLDIGCGFGELALFLAKNYHVHVTGVTISEGQLALAQEKCEPVKDLVDLRLLDYRELPTLFPKKMFDRVVSVGMFEHVGHKNYDTFFEIANRMLKDNGVFVLHTIGGLREGTNDLFLEKYIFPGGQLSSIGQVTTAARKNFITWDFHEFGEDYARTLAWWRENYEAWWATLSEERKLELFGKSFPEFWDSTPAEKRVVMFDRMWHLYLGLCQVAFELRWAYLWQFVFTKNGHRPSYGNRAPR